MPVYDYECDVCNHEFEKKQRYDEESGALCPRCKGKAHRVIRSVPIIFKGSGFYITDSRKGKEREKTEEKKPKESKKKEQVKGESTTATGN